MKNKNKKEDEDPVSKFWNKYIDSDCIERSEILDDMPIIKEMMHIAKIEDKDMPANLKLQSFTTLIKSYFDDLIEVMRSRK